MDKATRSRCFIRPDPRLQSVGKHRSRTKTRTPKWRQGTSTSQAGQLAAILLVPCVKSSTGWVRRKLMAKELAKAFDVPAWLIQNLTEEVLSDLFGGKSITSFKARGYIVSAILEASGNSEGRKTSWITSEMHTRLQLLVFWIHRNPRAYWRKCNRSKPKFLSFWPKLPLNVVPKKAPRRTLPRFQSSFGIKRWDSIEVAQVNTRMSRKSRFEKPYCSSETVCTPDGA